jgi:hypothetical protein
LGARAIAASRVLKVTFRANTTVLELIASLITYQPQVLDTLGLPGAQSGTHDFVQIAENFGRIHFPVRKIRKNRVYTYSGVPNPILTSAKLASRHYV